MEGQEAFSRATRKEIIFTPQEIARRQNDVENEIACGLALEELVILCDLRLVLDETVFVPNHKGAILSDPSWRARTFTTHYGGHLLHGGNSMFRCSKWISLYIIRQDKENLFLLGFVIPPRDIYTSLLRLGIHTRAACLGPHV